MFFFADKFPRLTTIIDETDVNRPYWEVVDKKVRIKWDEALGLMRVGINFYELEINFEHITPENHKIVVDELRTHCKASLIRLKLMNGNFNKSIFETFADFTKLATFEMIKGEIDSSIRLIHLWPTLNSLTLTNVHSTYDILIGSSVEILSIIHPTSTFFKTKTKNGIINKEAQRIPMKIVSFSLDLHDTTLEFDGKVFPFKMPNIKKLRVKSNRSVNTKFNLIKELIDKTFLTELELEIPDIFKIGELTSYVGSRLTKMIGPILDPSTTSNELIEFIRKTQVAYFKFDWHQVDKAERDNVGNILPNKHKYEFEEHSIIFDSNKRKS